MKKRKKWSEIDQETRSKIEKIIGKNRVVGYHLRPTQKMRQPEYYERVSIPGREKLLERSKAIIGDITPIVINVNPERFGVVIDGWLRVRLHDAKLIRVFEVDVVLEEEKRIHCILNQVSSDFLHDDIRKYLGKLTPEDFGLKSIEDEETPDDPDYHRKREELALKNAERTIKFIKVIIKKSEHEEIKMMLGKLKEILSLSTDSEVILTLIKKYYDENNKTQ